MEITGDKTSKEWRQVQENLPSLATTEEEESQVDYVKGGNEAGVAREAWGVTRRNRRGIRRYFSTLS